jgi:outer membrane receptor for ferrienterochelin and colicins
VRAPRLSPTRAGPLAALALLAPAAAGAQRPAADSTPVARAVRVVDAQGAPVPGAELRVDGRDARVLRTDADGVARLRAPAGARYVARAVGFAPRAGTLPAAGADTLTVRLTAAALSLDQVVVTAARRAQRLGDAVVTTEVVGRREIEQTGATDLAAVLTEQTGVQLQGGHPSGAGVMLQGIGAERVLILIDGQPIVGRLSGTFDLSRVPTGMVERVEVVKGPQSTLYGSEAMGGVVNIVTRAADAEAWTGTVTAFGGTAGRRDGVLQATAARGALSAVVDAGMRAVHRAPGRAEEAGALADRANASLKARWAPRAADASAGGAPAGGTPWVEASALLLDERQRWASAGLFDFADNRQLGARLSAGLPLGGTHRLTPTLYVSQFDHLARRSLTPSPVAGSGDRQVQRLAEAELLYAGRVAGLAVDGGVEARQEFIRSTDGRIRTDDGAGRRTLRSAEPFAQVELGGGAWSVVPGARLTWNEQWGTALTPRVAARWRAAAPLTLRLSAGRGFRAPDFKELYLQFTNDNAGYAVYGNPALRPEHSDNLTAGAEWSAGRAYARAQLFHNTLRDFIETRAAAPAGSVVRYEYANVEQGRTRGAELETGVTAGALRAEAAYAYLDAEDRATGRALLGRPTHSGRVQLAGALPLAVRGAVTGVYTGATPMTRDADGRIVGTRDPFFRVDVRLARRLTAGPTGLELVLGADNLFDRRPALWEGAVARQLYTSLAWSFRSPARTAP